MSNKTNHKKQYVWWTDWEAFLLKEWFPFKTNDFAHLVESVSFLKGKVRLLFIEISFILAFLAIVMALLSILVIKLI